MEKMYRAVGLSDKAVRQKTRENCPGELYLEVTMVEAKSKMVQMTFITNIFEWLSFSICQLYQC